MKTPTDMAFYARYNMASNSYFEDLNYTLGDEDSAVEHGMLPIGSGHVVTVAGSGGRVVPLLARAPNRLTCVDITPVQLELTRFRLAALARFEHEDFLGLLGYKDMEVSRRLALLKALGWSSSSGVTERLVKRGEGLVYQGRFERMLARLASFSSLMLGDARQRLFECASLDEQRAFLETEFPRRRWRLLLEVLGNSKVLNALLYRGAFPPKNRAGTYSQIYRAMFDQLFSNVIARNSFFLQMILLGKLHYESGFPVECRSDVYAAAQNAITSTKLDFACGDITSYVSSAQSIDFVSLSDVPSFLPETKAAGVLRQMRPGLNKGGIVVMRGHMRVVTPVIEGFVPITDRFCRLINGETTQLWQIDAFARD